MSTASQLSAMLPQLGQLDEIAARHLVSKYSDAELSALWYDWSSWARAEQLWPIGDWPMWLAMAGRGWGKTRVGAEATKKAHHDGARRIALVAPTAADARDVMVEGESGLLSVYHPSERPRYYPSRRLVIFRDGARAQLFSAEEPERLRGPQFDFAWCDEIAAWAELTEAWNNLMFGLRLGKFPRVVATTTPKPIPALRKIIDDKRPYITRGSTYENRANLAQSFLDEIERVYEGTRIGRQEIRGELLSDSEGALWNRTQIEQLRVKEVPCELLRIVVAVDPSTTAGPDSDECGIVVVGRGVDGHAYVLSDGSGRLQAYEWGARAVNAYHHWEADRIIGEANNGGDLVEVNVRVADKDVSFEKVWASRGKVGRAEPCASLYEKGKVHHVGGFSLLEDEMCNFVPGQLKRSPNRCDALVWGVSFLMLAPEKRVKARYI